MGVGPSIFLRCNRIEACDDATEADGCSPRASTKALGSKLLCFAVGLCFGTPLSLSNVVSQVQHIVAIENCPAQTQTFMPLEFQK